jgi:endonuclease/exonuclease/phosphatase family metal-dependent hydrolase
LQQLDADVVAIQEIVDAETGRPEYNQARLIAGQLPQYAWCFGENRRLPSGRYGNMTLSRLPMGICHNYDVTWRKRERRGCLRTDISLAENVTLHIFNVHHGTGFVERRHQAHRLLSDEVLKQNDLAGPRIVLGDFNEWTRGLATRLMGSEFEAVEPRAFLRYSRTYPGVFPLLHLDHFYFDKQLTLRGFRLVRSRTALIASDHLPLVADFALRRA